MALEPLYTVGQIADYFGVTQSTVLRWIAEYEDSNGKKGLRAGKINGVWRSRETWVKDYARVLYPTNEQKGA